MSANSETTLMRLIDMSVVEIKSPLEKNTISHSEEFDIWKPNTKFYCYTISAKNLAHMSFDQIISCLEEVQSIQRLE